MLTQEQGELIEKEYDCYVGVESEMWNKDNRDAIYGWEAIPQEIIKKALTL